MNANRFLIVFGIYVLHSAFKPSGVSPLELIGYITVGILAFFMDIAEYSLYEQGKMSK